ncbi:MAG: FecR domain-containing protein [Deltaproteobacteria bacterium]|nr:FecR domain-containing protein [Deltaproteobacteria bacterium]
MKKLIIFITLSAQILLPPMVIAQEDQAKVVSSRTEAKISILSKSSEAKAGDAVNKGSRLATDEHGRMSVLLPNHMLLKVAEKTQFTYNGFSAGEVSGDLKRGRVWLRGQKQKTPFQINTPSATAAIRGTEWYMEVTEDGTTTVGVIDGAVLVSNDLGQVELQSRELAKVEPGKPPVKLKYLTPENAVNWTLNYFGLWDKKDLARAGNQGSSIKKAIDSYYANDLKKAYDDVSALSESAASLSINGFLNLVSGRDALAKEMFQKAAKKDSAWALPIAHLSLIALVENDRKAARDYADQALNLEPNSSVALIASAFAWKANLKLEKANDAALKAVKSSPNFEEALVVAARIALEMNNLKESSDLLSKIDKSSNVLDQKETLQGYLDLRAEKQGSAIEHFQKALELNPDSGDALIGLGIALFKDNKTDEAIEAILEATIVDPQISSYQSYLAKAYFELGREGDVMKTLNRAKRLDPKDPTPYLYEALYYHAQYQPGKAFYSLQEARSRNNNRAVFRSQYLLDQDKSILTSNVAQVFNEIGFDQSATQEAARALEYDPTNSAAHRRQFFALQFDPRGYSQAASSERLLNNLFTPPTRSGVVLDEDALSPFSSIYDSAGVDPIAIGNYQYLKQNGSYTDNFSLGAILAAQLDAPVAFAITAVPSYADSESDLSFNSPFSSSDGAVDSITVLKNFGAFVKWQVTPELEIFVDGNISDTDNRAISSSNSTFSFPTFSSFQRFNQTARMGMPPAEGDEGSSDDEMGPPPVPTPQTSTSESNTNSDIDLYDVDLGLHYHPNPDSHALVHFSYHKDDSFSYTESYFDQLGFPTTSTLRADGGNEFWIAQAALWQRFDNHFFQIGARHYDEDITSISDSISNEVETITDSGTESSFSSAFVVDQYRGIKDVIITAGLNIDRAEFIRADGRDNNKTSVGPSLGATWQVADYTYLRAAMINNMAGDRSERLQQTLIAGVPWQRLTLIEPFTNEELFNLDYEAYVAGIDHFFDEAMIAVGAEAEIDKQKTQALSLQGVDSLVEVKNDTKGARFYVEALLDPQFSTGITYRFDKFQFPVDTVRNGVDVFGIYFSDFGLAYKLRAGWFHIQEDQGGGLRGGDVTTYVLEPSIEGYPFDERIRVDLRAPMTNAGERTIRFNFIWYYNH